MHWIIGIVLLVTGVLIIAALVVTYSQAEDVNANVNIDNDAPVIDVANAEMFQDPGDDGTNSSLTGFVATPGPTMIPTLGGNTNILLKVNVQDSNGWASQPINLSARLMATDAAGTSLAYGSFETVQTNDVFTQPKPAPAACTAIANISATERTFLCGINSTFNAAPTTPLSPRSPVFDWSNGHWRVLLKASDGVVNVELLDSVHYEIPVHIGFTGPTSFDLGSIATDGTLGPQANYFTENKGNQQIDLTAQVTGSTDAAAWNCTGSGNPLVSDVHMGPYFTDTNYAVMNPLNLNGDPFTHTDHDQTAVANSTGGFNDGNWFQMATTQSITPGVCTLSSIVLTAVKGF